MDTIKRQLERGRQMRLHVGPIGPIPGVQAFECNSTVDIERNGEFDSDEQIVTLGLPQFTGSLEVLDHEYNASNSIWRGLTGKDDSALSDVVIDNFGQLPVMLNVWNRAKTKFTKSYLVIAPTWTSFPYSTSLNNVVTMRMEFESVKGVKFPKHACAFESYTIGGAPTAGPYTIANHTAVKLGRKFGGQYVAMVVEKKEDPVIAGEFDFRYLCVASSTSTSFTLTEAPQATSTLYAYYAYLSTAEAGGYICSTL